MRQMCQRCPIADCVLALASSVARKPSPSGETKSTTAKPASANTPIQVRIPMRAQSGVHKATPSTKTPAKAPSTLAREPDSTSTSTAPAIKSAAPKRCAIENDSPSAAIPKSRLRPPKPSHPIASGKPAANNAAPKFGCKPSTRKREFNTADHGSKLAASARPRHVATSTRPKPASNAHSTRRPVASGSRHGVPSATIVTKAASQIRQTNCNAAARSASSAASSHQIGSSTNTSSVPRPIRVRAFAHRLPNEWSELINTTATMPPSCVKPKPLITSTLNSLPLHAPHNTNKSNARSPMASPRGHTVATATHTNESARYNGINTGPLPKSAADANAGSALADNTHKLQPTLIKANAPSPLVTRSSPLDAAPRNPTPSDAMAPNARLA